MNKILEELQKFSITKYGFFPEIKPRELPDTFNEWKQLKLNIARHLKNESLVDFVNEQLKQISCDSTNLPDEYLQTASVYITHIAHAYAYEVRRKKQSPKEKITFPDNIELPWQQITLRLGRAQPQGVFYEYFSWNMLDEETLLFNLFNSNTNIKFSTCFSYVEKTLGKCVPHVYAIHKHLTNYTLTPADLRSHLLNMIEPIYAATANMRTMINTSRFDAEYYVNPALWTKTSAVIGASSRDGEVGMSGGAAPVFKLLDIFVGRKRYDSELGRQMLEKVYLDKHVEFMNKIQANVDNVLNYIFEEANGCSKLFSQISQLYYGEYGYFGVHQKKVYGFMLVGLSAGRTSTNGGTLNNNQNNAVQSLDHEFTKARKERDIQLKSNETLTLRVKRSIMMGSDLKHLLLDAQDKLFRIWPGDKLSIVPKNSEQEINSCLDAVRSLIDQTWVIIKYNYS